MLKKFLILSAIFIISSCLDLQAQVVVRKSAKDRNPTLMYRDISGNPELSKLIASDLKNCGWFDLVDSGAEYVVTGTAAGAQLQTNVSNGNGSPLFALNSQVNTRDLRSTAHKTVDAILKKMFNIAGICSSKIAFAAQTQVGKKEIFTCDFDGQNITQLTFNNTLSVEPDWIPGRDAIVFTLYSKMFTDVVELDINSKRCRKITQFPGLNSGAAVSPNGSQLAIILSRDRQVELYVKSLGGQELQRLTNGIGVEASPCWSPSGDKLCFVSDMGGRPGLYVISPRGGTPVKLSTQGSEAVSPSWSSDNKIAYSAKMGDYAIAILDLNGKEAAKTVVNAAGNWESPSWAPDARHVVCTRTSGGTSALFVVDTWTGKTRQLLGGKMNTVLPSWSGIR
jgi:TolB protein